MTGLKNAFREYLIKKKYKNYMWVFTIFSMVLFIMAGYMVIFFMTIYMAIMASVISINTDAEFALPLSDSDLKKKYLNAVLLKNMKMWFCLACNIVVGLVFNNLGYGDLLRSNTLEVAMFYSVMVLWMFYEGMARIQDSMVYLKTTKLVDKGITRIIGTSGTVLYFVIYTLFGFQREHRISNELGMTLVIIDMVALIIGIIGMRGKWEVKDNID